MTTTPANGALPRRILSTAAAIALYELLNNLTLPTVDRSVVEQVSADAAQFHVALLGIWPFVTGALLVELFAWMAPSGKRVREKGLPGRRRIDRWAIWFGTGFCLAQAYSVAIWLGSQEVAGHGAVMPERGTLARMVTVVSLTAGAFACLALARWITRFGLGNGIALVSAWPLVNALVDALGLTFPGSGQIQPVADVVPLLTLVAVSVFACVILLSAPRTFTALDENRRGLPTELPALPQTLSSAVVASTLLFLPYSLGPLLRLDPALVERLFPRGWAFTLASALLLLAVSVPLASWIYGRARLERELAPRFSIGEGFTGALSRQSWAGIAFLLVGETVFSLPPLISGPLPSLPLFSFTSVVLAVAVALDLVAHARFVHRHGEATAVAQFDNVPLAAALGSSLEADGIPMVIQGYRPRSLSALFAPLVKMRILVPPEYEEEARRRVALEDLSVI